MAINKSGRDARQGERRPFVLRALIIGIILTIAAFFVIAMFTGSEQPEPVPAEQSGEAAPAEESGDGASGTQQ